MDDLEAHVFTETEFVEWLGSVWIEGEVCDRCGLTSAGTPAGLAAWRAVHRCDDRDGDGERTIDYMIERNWPDEYEVDLNG